MNTLGIILARAGSEGLKNKHLLPLLGKPVISYSFDHARSSSRLSRVVVSTDCPQITMLARSEGLETIARPAQLATSDASVQATIIHAMHEVERNSSFRADALVVIYGNIPVRGEGVFDRAIEMLQSTGCDSVRSWCPVGKWHPAWMARLENDRVVPLHAGSIHRRQDLAPCYLHDGAVVAISRASIMSAEARSQDPHAFFGIDRRGFETSMGETVEIDHQRDLYWAEAVLRDREAQHRLRMAS